MSQPRYRCSLLVVDDDPAVLALLVGQLGDEFDIFTSSSSELARRMLTERPIDIVLTDLQLLDGSGIQLLDWVHRTVPKTARVLLSGTARIEDAADAINCCRIHRLVLKPWRSEDLQTTLRSVARSLMIERSHDQLIDELRHSQIELEQRVQDRTLALKTALDELQKKNRILEKMALTDALTSLPNRRAIEHIARKELLRSSRTHGPVAFGLVDADHFKLVNSRYLLSGGDHVLAWLATTLQHSIRATDALGRVGGEEFMVVAPDTDVPGAEILAERLRAGIAERPTTYHDAEISVTVSVGFAVSPAGIQVNYEHLREQAALALSQAKAEGRNRCVVRTCDEKCSLSLLHNLPAESELKL